MVWSIQFEAVFQKTTEEAFVLYFDRLSGNMGTGLLFYS